MIKTGSTLTARAQEFFTDYTFNKAFAGVNNPFYNTENGDFYLRYDNIRLTNFDKIDGVGIYANYYWKGEKISTFPINNVSLDMAPALNSLRLEGIEGSFKVVVLDTGTGEDN